MPDQLTFNYSTIHEIVGLTAPEEGDVTVLDGADSGVWACITRDPQPHRHYLDEGAAIGTMLLRGMVGSGPSGTFGERLKAETEAVAQERIAKGKNTSYLVLRFSGQVPDWESRTQRELDECVIRLNGAPEFGLRDRARVARASLVIAIARQVGRPIQLRRHAEGLVFFRADGKKVYAKQITGGPVGVIVSGPWDASGQPSLQADFLALQATGDLTRVRQLFAASLDMAHDRLRAFLAGWSSLEILVNKTFPTYEANFLGNLASEGDSEARGWYVERIRDVMKDKYRLRDRFALVASTLDPNGADQDVNDFVAAEKTRDFLAHGRDIPDTDLPIETVHRLLGKYLHLHATREESSAP